MDIIFGLVLLVSLFGVTLTGEYCTVGYSIEYCSHNCCRDSCCAALETWAISLLAMGVFLFIALIVVAICCWQKKNGRMGRVMGFGQATVTTVSYVQPPPGYQPGFQPGHQPGYQPSHGFQQQSLGIQPLPPAYGQASAYPPAYGAQPNCNPAFPPRQY